MSKRAAIKRHVRTSIVARIIYRIACLALIVLGILGLFFTYSMADKTVAYMRRDKKTNATVVNNPMDNRKEDPAYDDYDMCDVKYEFEVNGKSYNNDNTWENLPNAANCHLTNGQSINIYYQNDNPNNNAYGDNSFSKELNLFATIVLAVLSILPLGFGFVGLVAIHKALIAEDELEEEEAKRYYRRQAKISKGRDEE
ncbi:MAG: DUF3592 domain-containing protein [Candidatus Saccharibacteria bacterium]|nr:DUF3592 domain-containing protein [Candidatus Saccharibacteria bacterium]